MMHCIWKRIRVSSLGVGSNHGSFPISPCIPFLGKTQTNNYTTGHQMSLCLSTTSQIKVGTSLSLAKNTRQWYGPSNLFSNHQHHHHYQQQQQQHYHMQACCRLHLLSTANFPVKATTILTISPHPCRHYKNRTSSTNAVVAACFHGASGQASPFDKATTILSISHHSYNYKPCTSSTKAVIASSFHKASGQTSSLDHTNDDSDRNGSRLLNIAQDILTKTEKVDVMAGSIPLSQVEQLIEGLQSLGLETKSIKMLLSGKLWLLHQTEATVALCRLLLDHGLTSNLICQVIGNIPLSQQSDILIQNIPEKINEMLLFYRNFGFSEKEIFTILYKDASVLFLEDSSVRLAVARMKAFFPAAYTKKVISMSPNVLYDDWSNIQAKFNYCVFIMGYVQSDIVRSHLFSHSLDHIRDRHIFLERTGVFQVVNKKLDPSLNVNPELKRVVDSYDSSFVKLVEGVSVRDYRVFKKMREIERENEELHDMDGDDESDDEYEEESDDDVGVDERLVELSDLRNKKSLNLNLKKKQKGFKKKDFNFKKKMPTF